MNYIIDGKAYEEAYYRLSMGVLIDTLKKVLTNYSTIEEMLLRINRIAGVQRKEMSTYLEEHSISEELTFLNRLDINYERMWIHPYTKGREFKFELLSLNGIPSVVKKAYKERWPENILLFGSPKNREVYAIKVDKKTLEFCSERMKLV